MTKDALPLTACRALLVRHIPIPDSPAQSLRAVGFLVLAFNQTETAPSIPIFSEGIYSQLEKTLAEAGRLDKQGDTP